jgi:hypothetical protein
MYGGLLEITRPCGLSSGLPAVLRGVRLRHRVDGNALPPEEAQTLHGMVRTAGFIDLPETIAAPARGANRF